MKTIETTIEGMTFKLKRLSGKEKRLANEKSGLSVSVNSHKNNQNSDTESEVSMGKTILMKHWKIAYSIIEPIELKGNLDKIEDLDDVILEELDKVIEELNTLSEIIKKA